MSNSTLWYRRCRADSYFAERRAEIIGARLRKPRRTAAATILFHMERWLVEKRAKRAISAAKRLDRAMGGGA